MKECPAIVAALPREIQPLVRGWKEHRLPGNILAYTNDNAVVVCAGMGAQRAVLAVQTAMQLKPVTALLSVGLAGACDPSLDVGAIVRAGEVIDVQTGERFSNSQFRQVVVSVASVANVQEKQRLYATYYASAVDMEAAAVAHLAKAHGLYFQVTKAISDKADFEMGLMDRFVTADGQFREAAFAAHAILRPWLWKELISLALNSKRAIAALTVELKNQLDWYKQRG
jgi:adenosylhomocysteine nucleosidase